MFKKIFAILLLSIFILVNSNLLSQEKWLTSLKKAKEVAKKTNKDIFINFTGSDWCKWCKRLDKEVFSTKEWKEEAPKKFILVKLDFPRMKKLSEQETKINQKIAQGFEVRGFPTVCLLDPNGKIYAKTGYARGGVKNYLKLLDALSNKKNERDLLIGQVEKAAKIEDKVKAVDQLLNLMARNQADFAYLEYKIKAVELDPLNNYKMNEKYSTQLFYYYSQKENMAKQDVLKQEYKKKSSMYLDNLKKFKPDVAHNLEIQRKLQVVGETYIRTQQWKKSEEELKKLLKLKPTGMTAQIIYYLIGVSNLQLGQIASSKPKSNKQEGLVNNFQREAIINLQKALKADPKSQLARRISMFLNNLKRQIKKVKMAPKNNK